MTKFIQLTAYGDPVLFQVREIVAVEPYRGNDGYDTADAPTDEGPLPEVRWIKSIISVGSREPISHEYAAETVDEIRAKLIAAGAVVIQ